VLAMPDARDGQLLRVLFLTPSVRLMGARVSMLEFLRRVPRERDRAIVAVHAEGDLTRALQEAGIETRRILYRNYRKGKYFPLIPYAVSRLAALIRRERIDIVHSNEFWVNPYGVMAARLGGAASLCHFRTSRTPRVIGWGRMSVSATSSASPRTQCSASANQTGRLRG